MLGIQGSAISCGIRQLSVGEFTYITQSELRDIIKTTGKRDMNRCCMLIASFTDKQVATIAELERIGFMRVTEYSQNPNSGNNIALWVAAVKNGKVVDGIVRVKDDVPSLRKNGPIGKLFKWMRGKQ